MLLARLCVLFTSTTMLSMIMLQQIQYSAIALAGATEVSSMLPPLPQFPSLMPPRSARVIPRHRPLAGDTR